MDAGEALRVIVPSGPSQSRARKNQAPAGPVGRCLKIRVFTVKIRETLIVRFWL